MRLRIILLSSLFISAPLTFGDVIFQTPGAGLEYPGGTAFTVTWIDSGIAPSISDLTSYVLELYTGSNAAPVRITSTALAADNDRAITDADGSGTSVDARSRECRNKISLSHNSNRYWWKHN